MVYMAETTTIRVSTRTRDVLNSLAARRGQTAGDVVATLAAAADEERWLEDIAASFRRLADDPEMLRRYRAESEDLESFTAPVPDW